MAFLTDIVQNVALTSIDTVKQTNLGKRARDEAGKEYIYLKGVASTVAGSWVTFDKDGNTTLLAGNAVGKVAVALAATVANTFGWYQVYGPCAVTASDTTAANKALYIDGTAGRVDDLVVAGDLIVGAHSTAADATNVLAVDLNYPYVTDILG